MITYMEIAYAFCSFQTLVVRFDEDTIIIMSKDGFNSFYDLLMNWKEKYPHKKIAAWSEIEAEGIEFTNEQAETFFKDYPKLKKQLEINEKYGYNIWMEYPEGLQQDDIDLIHREEWCRSQSTICTVCI